MANRPSNSFLTLEEQLENALDDLSETRNQVHSLQDDIKACKEFFGYDPDMSVEEMVKYRDDCEEEEKAFKENDPDYADQCDRSDQLADLVVELGEHQYSVAEVYTKLKQLSPDTTGLRKNFTSDFAALKDSVPEEHVDDFFSLVHEWLDLQKKIHDVDCRIADAKS